MMEYSIQKAQELTSKLSATVIVDGAFTQKDILQLRDMLSWMTSRLLQEQGRSEALARDLETIQTLSYRAIQ
jgi:hypothetical protein